MRFKMASAIVGALILASSASAAIPIYWTPAKMVKALTALQYPHAGILGGVCRGATKARHGTYAGFRCVMTWQIIGTGGASTTSGKAVAYAKPLTAGRVCGSTRSLRACIILAAGPLAGDPTVCAGESSAQCAHDAAKNAIVAKHGVQVNLTCTQGSTVYSWSCTSSAGPYTVMFTKGTSAWTTTVTP